MAARPRRGSGSGSEELARVREKLRDGWPAGLTVLTGDDTYHLDRAQHALLETLVPPDESDFALSVFGQDRVEVGSVVSAVRSAGMFASRRVVLVRDLLALDGEPEPIVEYAAAPPPRSYLLVRAPAPDLRRKLHKGLFRAGTTLAFLLPSPDAPGALVKNLKAVAAECGLELEPPAARLLLELFGADLYRLAGELDKLRLWMGEPARKVTEAMVREVVSSGGMISGFEVANAVMDRDRGRALAEARRLVEAGEEPIRIVGGIAWSARKTLERARGASAGRYRVEELLAFPAALLEADRTLKSRSIDPRAVLESLVDRLVTPAPRRRRAERR
jgi:DNA polymerase-3 subunit delta